METGHTVGWTKQHIQTLLNAMKSSIPSQAAEKRWSEGLKTLDWNKVAFEPFSAEECSAKWLEIIQKIRKVKTLLELIVDAQNVFSNEVTRKKFPLVPKSPEIKDKYLQRAQTTKEEHRNSMKTFCLSPRPKGKQSKKSSHTKERSAKSSEQLQSLLIKKSSREENETKTKLVPPPMTGYNLFCKEQKDLMTGVPILEIPTTWSHRWNNLTDMEKSKYTRRCAEMKEEYNVKLNHFLNDLDDGQAKTLIPTLKRKQVTTRRVFPGEPKMLTRSTKSFFRKTQKEKLKYLQCKSEPGTSHHRTSDSEDEVLEVSSSSDSDVIVEQEEDEEDEEDIMFDIY